MLDILANNDWKRPIYFSGGSFEDSEFIWMKDYLQLDGLAFKLVPIKTERSNAFEMGRIDTKLMYDIVKKWDWGNSGDPNIYHDTQTRIQGLTYRGNLARLMESLINENEIDKAKEIIDIAISNMPIEQFGYYTMVEPFVDGYYKVGETSKARNLYNSLKKIYQERLEYYAGLEIPQQHNKLEEIYADIQAYRRNIDVLIINNDREIAEKETLIFNEYIDKFARFYEESDETEEELNFQEDPDMENTIPLTDTIPSEEINQVDSSTVEK